MREFAPATGKTLWSLQIPGQSSFWAAPTYKQGLIYTAGNGTGQTMYAVTADGTVAWSSYSGATGASTPAVGTDRVFEVLDCPAGVIAYDRLTGDVDWHYAPSCPHGSATTPALYQGRVYERQTTPDAEALDAPSGNSAYPFTWGTIPAFSNGHGFQVANHQLRAFDVQTGATNWTFDDPHAATGGYLNSAPLVVNDHVLVGSAEGMLYAVDTATGNLDWHGHAGSTISWLDEWYGEAPLAGLAAGSGTLVVPAGSAVVAYSGT
jgi:outer membrane protein assembly factor BamB